MKAYILYSLVILLPPILGIMPPFKRGRAFNGLFTIHMPDRSVYKDRHSAVLTQEIVEWYAAHLGAIIIAAVPAYIISVYTPLGLAAPVLAILAWNWRSTDWGRRQLEYIGWGAEWMAGRKSAPKEYNDFAEHAELLRLGYAVFSGFETKEVSTNLKRWLPLAATLRILLGLYVKRHSR